MPAKAEGYPRTLVSTGVQHPLHLSTQEPNINRANI